ncbi:MAG: hypothetical protein U5K33_09385 [Halofilum sp. (in: g-proteobacteria)]|nr:hypothetical protein [Halofilum sp. (in: g-proteobacteria)]
MRFPNSDETRHHVYSFSEAKTFELQLYAARDADPVVFDRAGVVTLGCNIHDWMLGYLLVLDTPAFDRTGNEGRARCPICPPGRYRVELWHPRLLPGEVPPPHGGGDRRGHRTGLGSRARTTARAACARFRAG